MRAIWILAAIMAVASSNRTLGAVETHAAQPSMPPTFIKVEEIDGTDATFTFSYTQLKPVIEFQSDEQPQNSAENAPMFHTHLVPEQRMRQVPMDDLHFVDTDGKKVKTDKALDRLSVGAILLRMDQAQELDSGYKKALAKDILILVLKTSP